MSCYPSWNEIDFGDNTSYHLWDISLKQKNKKYIKTSLEVLPRGMFLYYRLLIEPVISADTEQYKYAYTYNQLYDTEPHYSLGV